MNNTEDAIQHLEKAKEELELAEKPEAYAEVSNLKRSLEVEKEMN